MDTNSVIEWLPLEAVKPWEKNPRKNDGAVDTVAHSLKVNGWMHPIVVRAQDMTIAAGHTRWKAAKKLGYRTIPCIVEEMTDEKFESFAVMDNKSAEYATWDEPLLLEVMNSKMAVVPLQDFGFTESEFKFMSDGFDFDLETKPKEGKEEVNLTSKLQLIVPNSILPELKNEIEKMLKERGYAKDVAIK